MLLKDIEITKRLFVSKPILLIDEAEFDENEQHLSSCLYLSEDLYFWKHHFINNPTMPGTLMLEMLAQSAALLEMMITDVKQVPIIVNIKNVRFLREVKPKRLITAEVKIKEITNQYYTTVGKIICDEKTACKAELIHVVKE